MSRRAIILVPGFGRKEQGNERDKLASAMRTYADGWKVVLADEAPADTVRLIATSREGDVVNTIDLYEAYWGDLIPDWSEESPLNRFKRGTNLIWYWLTGGLRGWLAQRRVPPRTSFAMVIAALMLLFWYLIVILFVVQIIGTGGYKLPAELASIKPLETLWNTIGDWAKTAIGSAVIVFAIWLWGLGFLEQFANISAYTKAYLRDETFGGSEIGLRAKARHRVLAALDTVEAAETAQDGRSYDEIGVVAHSLGGAIALDALAEYGPRLEKTVLMTWGSALGSLAQQEPLIERQIARLYESETRIHNWIDIVFRKDFMGSKAPLPRKFVNGEPTKERHEEIFPTTFAPVLPKGMSMFEMVHIHEAYFRCEDAIIRLVAPFAEPPRKPEDQAASLKLAVSG